MTILSGCGGGGGGGGSPSAASSSAPTITAQPQNATANVGYAVTLAVTATGSPPLSYQWQKNGADIAGATAASFTISAAALSDSGTYAVIVSNSAGSVTSSSATIAANAIAAACTATATLAYGATTETLLYAPAVVEITGAPSGTLSVYMDYFASTDSSGTALDAWNYAQYALDSMGNCTKTADLKSTAGVTVTFTNSAANSRLFLSMVDPTVGVTNTPYLGLCAYSGSTAQTCDPVNFYIGGKTVDNTQKPISGVTVNLVNNATIQKATSDAKGIFVISTPLSTLPPASTLTFYKDSTYVPSVLEVIQQPPLTVSTINTVVLPVNGPNYAVIEIEPVVHHIGDSNYTGAANQQFQFPNAEGSSFSRTFTVQTASLAFAHASLNFVAKGVQCADTVTINGATIFVLAPSAADGSYSAYSFPITPSVFTPNSNNTIVITSVSTGGATCTNPLDLDDFEFANVIVQFSN